MADAFTVGRTPLPPKTMVSIPAKQLPSYAGSAQAAAEDVKLYLKQDYRVVVLAGDERRAKVLQDFFKEHDKVMEQLGKAKAKMNTKIEEKKAERIALRDEIIRLDLYYTNNGEE
jgi:hypothetical protein